MLEALLHWDTHLFLNIHHYRNAFFDLMASGLSNRWVWIPLYLLLFLLIVQKWKKQAWLPMVLIALLVLCADQTANLVKNSVKRPRPCHNEAIAAQITTPDGCGGPYGFYSGHAANSTAIAMFIWLMFRSSHLRYQLLLLFVWSFAVAWSRIYQGVHYPLDVLTGIFTGLFWGWIFYRILNFLRGRLSLEV
jgi:undecaprenyl-diphosphatase